MKSPALEAYYDRLSKSHAELQKCVAGLPQEALDWSPGADMNSLAVLITHVAGAERYWIGDVVGRDPSNRQREVEFRAHGEDERALIARLEEVLIYSRMILERLTLPDLEAERTTSREEPPVTVLWCLAHALEHAALHLGHAQITRQLWDQRQAP